MKSTTWLVSTMALAGAVALYFAGCAKDESQGQKSQTTPTAPATTPIAPTTNKLPVPNGTGVGSPFAKPDKKDNSYKVAVEAPASVAKDAEGVVRVRVTPSTGWKMNKEFPTRLKVSPPAGVTLVKDEQKIEDAEKFADQELTFAVKFTGQEAGEKSFEADFRFAVCTDATCDPKKEKLTWVVKVD